MNMMFFHWNEKKFYHIFTNFIKRRKRSHPKMEAEIDSGSFMSQIKTNYEKATSSHPPLNENSF